MLNTKKIEKYHKLLALLEKESKIDDDFIDEVLFVMETEKFNDLKAKIEIFERLSKESESGYALNVLGNFYLKDDALEKAQEVLTKSYHKGYFKSAYELGFIAFTQENYKIAIPYLSKAALLSNYDAIALIALYQVIDQNYDYGFAIINDALFSCEKKFNEVTSYLLFYAFAYYLYNGYSVNQDLSGALYFIEKAIKYAKLDKNVNILNKEIIDKINLLKDSITNN